MLKPIIADSSMLWERGLPSVIEYAKMRGRELFARWDIRGEYKAPDALIESLARRLEQGRALDLLVSNESISLSSVARVIDCAVLLYNDDSIRAEPKPEWRTDGIAIAEKKARRQREAKLLSEFADRAEVGGAQELALEMRRRSACCHQGADQLRALRDMYERSAPIGHAIVRGVGQQPRPDALFAHLAEDELEQHQLSPTARHALIAALCSDLWGVVTSAENIRCLVKESRRAKWSRRRKNARIQRLEHEARSARGEEPALTGLPRFLKPAPIGRRIL